MKLSRRLLLVLPVAAVAAVAVAALASSARAQGTAFVRLIRPYHQTALAQLAEVEQDLNLTDEQKTKALDLYDGFIEERRALWQEAAGDFESIREDTAKLTDETAAELDKILDETQQKRLQQIYVQTNGPTALFDAKVAAVLKLTDEQKTKLFDVRTEIFESFRNGENNIDWQSLSDEEANAEVDKMIADQNEKYAAVLTEEQRAEFEKLQGEKLEIDLGNLPNPFGG